MEKKRMDKKLLGRKINIARKDDLFSFGADAVGEGAPRLGISKVQIVQRLDSDVAVVVDHAVSDLMRIDREIDGKIALGVFQQR